jgi:MFS family permease
MNRYLPVLILFILADVVADNSILQVFGNQTPINALLLSTGILLLQVFSAPLQAGLSDFYCRKKSLLTSLSCSFFSIILLFFMGSIGSASLIFFILVAIIKGVFGNTVPLSWAALADTQEKNLRFSLALSTGAYAIGYMVLALSNMHSMRHENEHLFKLQETIPITLFIISIIYCALFFKDIRDRKTHPLHTNTLNEYLKIGRSEFSSLVKDSTRPSTRFGLLAYLFWSTSQYSVLILLTDFQTKYTDTVILMMLGYLSGVAILWMCKKTKDEKMIRTGFIITIFFFCFFFIGKNFTAQNNILLSVLLFFTTMSNAFLSPSILSLFAKERSLHQQGKGFGLIVSADSFGFLIASITVILLANINKELEYILLFSFVSFLLSWIPYLRYEKTRINLDKLEQ